MEYLFPLVGYLIGAVPFGLIIGMSAGVDVRTQGSCNIGATNVSRLLGKKLGLATLACDCLKGWLPIYLAATFLAAGADRQLLLDATGIAAVVGHMFPVYLRFRGGKGVATALGVFLFLSPLAIVISLAVFVGAVALTGFVSVGSLLASALIPLWLFLFGAAPVTIGAAAVIALMIWGKHHENIDRLIHGREKPWKRSKIEQAGP